MYSTRTHEVWQFWLDMWHVKAVFFLGTKKSFKLRNLPSRTSALFPSWRSTCPFPSQQSFLRIFWYILYIMLKECTLLKENLCIYKCFLDVLYILDSVLKKNWEMRPIKGRFSVNIFFAMCSKEFTCVNGSTIQSVLSELLLTANFWVFEWNFSRSNLSVNYCFLFVHS